MMQEKEQGGEARNRASEESEQVEDRARDRSAGQGKRAYALLVTAVVFCWNLARFYLAKTPLPIQSAPAMRVRTPPKTGRPADRSLDLESESRARTLEREGTLLVACSFGVGLAAGAGFLAVYWSGGSNELLGATLALTLGGFGAALVLCAHRLMRHAEATEPRSPLPSSTGERDSVFEDYCAGAKDVRRRGMLQWMGAAGLGVLAAMVLSLLRSLGMSPDRALFDTVWKRGQRLMTIEGKPVSVNSLQPGNSITVFPESGLGSEKTQTVLIRVNQQLLHLPEQRAAWAPMGYVAYSRVCTHAGCPVGIFESKSHLLLCPCHQSTFDVLRGALPVSGPAARPLPQLPLYADSDGNLRAGGGFSEPPGPGFWWMP